MSTMPVYFVSHGGGPWPYVESMRPMFAKTERELEALPGRLPTKPKAVLVVTGHWEAAAFTVSTAEHPPMMYDYGGFPEHTYHIRYPAPGSPALAARVKNLPTCLGSLPFSETTTNSSDFVSVRIAYIGCIEVWTVM
jgi:aromatic ring-opening dioxygenase catalytic subunit (LigB family)